MDDIAVKQEQPEDNDSNMTLPDLSELLEEVKREQQPSPTNEESSRIPVNEDENLPESFFDDLYRDELEADSTGITTEDDIQKLQELIEKKKRILNEELHAPDDTSPSKSRSCSPIRKRKNHDNSLQNMDEDIQAKRVRTANDSTENVLVSENESPISQDPPVNTNKQQPPSPTDANLTPTDHDEELELENLLKTEDYHSDEESPNTGSNTLPANMPQECTFPNAMPAMDDPSTNQMMGNMALNGFPMMYNMGFGPGFYPPNMMNMQMMGFGLPQMNVPSNQDEVQCLSVSTNSQSSQMPSFRPIKLEKKSAKNDETEKTALSAEERKRKVFETCTLLLKKMEFPEPTGKFVYTSTVSKIQTAAASNSILQNITNVSYNFQSIGPNLKLQNWRLKGMSNKNSEIAKKISMSADKYFEKMAENANTIARKLIKVENAKAGHNEQKEETEVEEPSMSSFLKNSMTQTDALVCRECVTRKRKVGHNIAVQATVFTSSIGSQTSSELNSDGRLTQGLNENQLKAMYEFSKLIREPQKNTSAELIRLREDMINLYNLSQQKYRGPLPYVDVPSSRFGLVKNSVRDPRINNPVFDPNRFIQSGMRNLVQVPMNQANTVHYPPREQYIPNQSNSPGQFPGHMRDDHGYQPGRPLDHAMQIANQQRHHEYPGHAAHFQNHELPSVPQADGVRRMYGRGLPHK